MKKLFLFILVILVVFIPGCASTASYDPSTFYYDIDSDQIYFSFLVTAQSKPVENVEVKLHLYDNENNLIDTVSCGTNYMNYGYPNKVFINENSSQIVHIKTANRYQNLTFIEIKQVTFEYGKASSNAIMYFFIIVFFLILSCLFYFCTKKSSNYVYKNYNIEAGTKFIICYININGQRVSSEMYLRWGATIETTCGDLNIVAVFRPGFFRPIITMVINGESLQEI